MSSSIRAVVFDMDGVLRVGESPIDGVNEALNHLKHKNIPYMISTNECRYTPNDLRDDLSEMGLDVEPNVPIYTAGIAAKDYIESKIKRFPNYKFIIGVIGASGLHLIMNDLTYSQQCVFSNKPPQNVSDKDKLYLVIGTVDKIKISTLEKAKKWIHAGAKVILTCCDISDPSSKGDFTLGMPNHVLHMVSFNTKIHRKNAYSTGKPHPIHKTAIMNTFPTLKPHEILFVGDTLYTDIRLAEESGFKSALVLSGNTDKQSTKIHVCESDFILTSIKDLHTIL
jgi:HAD superfamily hydrolase (TIGR01450 family)